ncbi:MULTISPECIES: D-glucuronyl C5-epimerase family protein [unclassified Luteococcus]|uniref:D-glucuronyl C5-epimerase family protein n=1 Tax=unclassified Luteococcus TaxID=2639923 RepID=UPI00313B61D3
MTSTPLTRRALLATATALPLAAALPEVADARAGWRLLAQQVDSPAKSFGLIGAGDRGGMISAPSDPIPRLKLKDGRVVIHPTQLGNLLNAHLDSYSRRPDREQLRFAATVMEALMQRTARRQGARFLAYEFNWHADGRPLPGPWYSSFGQSKFPRALHRLEQATGERKWARYRQEVVAAFHLPPLRSRPTQPWIAGVDANNCLWLEEYPSPVGRFSTVFNGHFYALAELGFYLQQTKDPLAREVVQGAAATLDFYRNYCRAPGRWSNYFANSTTNVPSYHSVNTSCYVGLWNLTGLGRVGTVSDQMFADWPYTTDTRAAGRIRVNPGVHQIQRPVGSGPGKPQVWKTTSPMVLRTTSRHRWSTATGTWLYMAEGPKSGFWVREQADLAFRVGLDTDQAIYTRPRPVLMKLGGPIVGYQWSADGVGKAVRSTSFSRSAVVPGTQRATLGGRGHILVTEGRFAGLWVRQGGRVNFQ